MLDVLPECDDCPYSDGSDGGCDKFTSILGDGSVFRHNDPPAPVVVWPGCPRPYMVRWCVGGNDGMSVSPSEYISWEYERGTHRGNITQVGGVLFREWIKLHGIVRKLVDLRSEREAALKLKPKNGKAR